MSAGLFLGVVCCFAAAEMGDRVRPELQVTLQQLAALHVAIEATPTEISVGDVVFIRVSLTNNGKEPVILPGWFSPFLGNMSLYLHDSKRATRFRLDVYGHADGGSGPRELRPGERWLLTGYMPMHVPQIEATRWPFWNPEGLSKDGYDLSVSLVLTAGGGLGGSGPTLKIRPRPEAELAKLLELCDSRSPAQRDFPPDWDSARPSLAWFVYPLAPRRASTHENLATLDAVLSPGTLRDLVRLTRRAQALYDTEDLEQKRKKLAELLDWLETFPHVQRQCMTDELIVWAINTRKVGFFAYEMAVEAALRSSLVDGDLETRRAWLKAYLQSPLAGPYLKDFEERFSPIEERPDHAPTPSDSPPDDAPEDEIEGDSFSG